MDAVMMVIAATNVFNPYFPDELPI